MEMEDKSVKGNKGDYDKREVSVINFRMWQIHLPFKTEVCNCYKAMISGL